MRYVDSGFCERNKFIDLCLLKYQNFAHQVKKKEISRENDRYQSIFHLQYIKKTSNRYVFQFQMNLFNLLKKLALNNLIIWHQYLNKQIKSALSYNLMDIQENQLVQNQQDLHRGNQNQSSSSSLSIVKEENNAIILNNQPQPQSPEPQVRLPVSNSDLPQNVANFILPSLRSEPALALRQEKSKRRKVRAYVQDFSDYLPQSLLIVNKTVIPAIMRKGERFQVNIPSAPSLKSAYRPMQQWLVWNGSSHPELKPTEDQFIRFKEMLGENRTQEQFIHIRQKMGMNPWKEVLEYISRNKGDLRRFFHVAQRNRH